jgi:hypothetical protein
MWPIDRLRKRKHDRRLKAAVVVLLGAYLSERLDAGQRAKVESELNDLLNESDNPAAAWRRWARWDVLAAYRAAAMQRAGVKPPIPETWEQLFAPWNHWGKWPVWPMGRRYDIRPAYLVYDYRPMNAATLEAKEYLRRHGMHIPDADPKSVG